MRHITGVLLLLLGILQAGLAQTTVVPEVLDASQTSVAPYAYNGFLGVDTSNGFASGSASMVENGVFMTAAHVVFDDVNLVWEPVNSISYYPQRHVPLGQPSLGGSFKPQQILRWASYRTRVENDGSATGESSRDTFNMDFAVGYFSGFYNVDSLLHFPESIIRGKGFVIGIDGNHRVPVFSIIIL